MTRERFSTLLDKATAPAISFARTMVIDPLPDEVRYFILDRLGRPVEPRMSKEEFVSDIWCGDSCHRHIDLSVIGRDEKFTHVGVLLSDARVHREEDCAYFARGLGPFGVKSPRLPANWHSVEKSGRFSLLP